jgi:hypothetical protein
MIRAHNQWLPKTRSIPYWTMSVFSSTVTDLVLIYESVTSSASVVHSWTLNYWTVFWILLGMIAKSRLTCEWTVLSNLSLSQFVSYVTTDGQSASLSWNKQPNWGLRPDFYYNQTAAVLLMGGALYDERTGLSFTIAAGPSQRSHFRVRVPLDSWPYFTVSDLTLPFSSPPTSQSQSYVTTTGSLLGIKYRCGA